MLRFIIKKRWASVPDGDARGEEFLTLDVDVPELEKRLRGGGMSQYGFEFYDLAGVEILRAPTTTRDGG